jgi:FecR protein
MKTRTGFSVAVLAAAILSLLPIAPAALAQNQDQGQYQDQGPQAQYQNQNQDQANYPDPPTRAGRIGFVQGSVSFQPGGQGDWLEAVPNRPLTTGDNLWTDKDSRAEIQIGSTSIRLGPETSLTFLDLGDDSTQLRLSTGTLFFRVRHFGGDDSFEVDAPNLAFNVNQAGEFRLDVNENGDQTVATVWRGEAEITGGGDSYRLDAGQQGTFSGTDQLSYDVAGIGSPDDFGRWTMSRDAREDQLQSRDYVSDEMTGYEDLDDYGQWHAVAGYGNVWSPRDVPGDWAPYRYGHWVFVAPWGWTWVEQEPWGFAPFHYGRWAFADSGWCWIPGPVAVRPVYSPALVAFIGGGGFHIGVGVGVGWFPLGPGEVFVPWYRTSPRYVQRVNITNTRVNVVQITNVYNNVTINHVTNITYVNQRVNNSVTVVNHDTFVNARPVHDNIVRVDAREMSSAPVGREALSNMRPARQSVLGSGRPVQMRPPDQVISRPVVATRQPVVFARPQGGQGQGQGIQRTAAPPPPVKMIRLAPATEAQPLQQGQRGSSQGFRGAPAAGGSRPGMPGNQQNGQPDNNRGGFPRPGDSNPQPGMRGNNPPPGQMVPRPGNPENGGNGNLRPNGNPQPGMNSQPNGNPQPNANPKPGMAPPSQAPQGDRGMSPDNNGAPQQVPRPPSAMRPPNQTPPPALSNNSRPDNGNNVPPPQNMHRDAPRPDTQDAPNVHPGNPPPQQAPPRAPQMREQPAPPPPPVRQDAAPEMRQEQPQPEIRREPVPRPEARPEPPPQEEPARVEQRTEKPAPPAKEEKPPKEDKDKDKDKDNKPPKFR